MEIITDLLCNFVFGLAYALERRHKPIEAECRQHALLCGFQGMY